MSDLATAFSVAGTVLGSGAIGGLLKSSADARWAEQARLNEMRRKAYSAVLDAVGDLAVPARVLVGATVGTTDWDDSKHAYLAIAEEFQQAINATYILASRRVDIATDNLQTAVGKYGVDLGMYWKDAEPDLDARARMDLEHWTFINTRSDVFRKEGQRQMGTYHWWDQRPRWWPGLSLDH